MNNEEIKIVTGELLEDGLYILGEADEVVTDSIRADWVGGNIQKTWSDAKPEIGVVIESLYDWANELTNVSKDSIASVLVDTVKDDIAKIEDAITAFENNLQEQLAKARENL